MPLWRTGTSVYAAATPVRSPWPDRARAGPCTADRSAQPDKYQDVDLAAIVQDQVHDVIPPGRALTCGSGSSAGMSSPANRAAARRYMYRCASGPVAVVSRATRRQDSSVASTSARSSVSVALASVNDRG